MLGVVHVLPYPFFAITDENGSFKIENVPPGSYKIEAWHERLSTQQLSWKSQFKLAKRKISISLSPVSKLLAIVKLNATFTDK